jgi:HlyD family secretion protein
MAGGAAAALLAAVVWLRVFGVPEVETVTMSPREFQAQAFGTGTVEARVTAEIGSKITGRVVRLLHDHGDSIEGGTLLAVLDSDELRQQREQAVFTAQKALEAVHLEQAALIRARATLEARKAAIDKTLANAELARVTFDRFKRLYDRELVARQDLDVRSMELRAAEADVLNARADVAALEAEVRRTEVAVGLAGREAAAAGAAVSVSEARLHDASVFAPFSGLILSRTVEPGAVIVPGAPLFKVLDPATIWVRINLDESLLGSVRVGQQADVSVRSRPGQTFRGEVVRIREESDRVAEESAVEIRLIETPPRLRIGEQAEATIVTQRVTGARVVPGLAVVQDERGRSAVFVVEDGHARRRPVKIGARDPRSGAVELAEGVADGERVVVGPPPFPSAVKDGQSLRLVVAARR